MASLFRSRLRGGNALGRMLAISFAIHLGAILMLVFSPWDFFRSERPPMVSYTVDLVPSDRLGGSAAPKSPPGAKPGVMLPPVAREGATEKGKSAAAARPPQPKPKPRPEPAAAKAEAEKQKAEQAKAEAARKQAEQVKAEAAKKQAEKAKAEAAKKQAEKAKAEAAKKQAEQAKALALKKKADAEKKKAEADAAAKKAEEAKKAEAAKKSAEEARKKEEAAKAAAKKAEEKKAAEKAAAEKAAAQKAAADKAAKEKAAKEKSEKEKAEKVAAEKAAAEKAEADAAKAEADAKSAREAIAAKLRDEHLAAAIEKLRGATAAENEVEGGTGLGGSGGGGVVQGLDFLLYKGVVENTIRQNWAWAGESPGLKVVVGFGIEADGRIVDLAVVEPSGDATYDNLALRAVQSSDPLPPPPEEYRGEFARYELELRAEDVGF